MPDHEGGDRAFFANCALKCAPLVRIFVQAGPRSPGGATLPLRTPMVLRSPRRWAMPRLPNEMRALWSFSFSMRNKSCLYRRSPRSNSPPL